MTPEQFCYWLQGYFEINQDLPELGEKEITVVKDHLQKVFNQNQIRFIYYNKEGGVIESPDLNISYTDVPITC